MAKPFDPNALLVKTKDAAGREWHVFREELLLKNMLKPLSSFMGPPQITNIYGPLRGNLPLWQSWESTRCTFPFHDPSAAANMVMMKESTWNATVKKVPMPLAEIVVPGITQKKGKTRKTRMEVTTKAKIGVAPIAIPPLDPTDEELVEANTVDKGVAKTLRAFTEARKL